MSTIIESAKKETKVLTAKQLANIAKKDAKKLADSKTENLLTINLNKYTSQLANFEGKIKSKRDTIYFYPENFTDTMKQGDEGRKFRTSLRRTIVNFCNNIFIYAKSKQLDKLKTEVESFNKHYKETYRLNDFSLKSISQSSEDAKIQPIELMLSIVKDINAAKK